MSLKVALEMLGLKPCYHMIEVWANPPAIADWVAAANGRPNWAKIFDGYECDRRLSAAATSGASSRPRIRKRRSC